MVITGITKYFARGFNGYKKFRGCNTHSWYFNHNFGALSLVSPVYAGYYSWNKFNL